jgi:acyl-CoA synthetase (AMP-forming)/AMP-acid ligase II
VRHQAAAQPARIALTFEDRHTNYATLDRRANQVANGLLAAGVRPATRIAVLDKNHDSFFEIWFGVAKAKAVMVPVNWRLAAPEIGYLVSDAQAEVLFVGSEYLDAVARIRDQLTSMREVIVTNQDYPAWRDRQSATDPQLPTAGSGCEPRGDATSAARSMLWLASIWARTMSYCTRFCRSKSWMQSTAIA